MSNYEVQDLRFCFNTAEIGGVSELRGYKLSGVNSMLFKWTEFKAQKKRLIMQGDVLTGVELSRDDSTFSNQLLHTLHLAKNYSIHQSCVAVLVCGIDIDS